NPGIHVSTGWVYQNLQLTKKGEAAIVSRSYGTLDEVCAILSNDLETVTIPRFPVICEIKERLLAAGAAGALMSGSGPTVFGVFAEDETARRACAAIKNEADWFAAVMQTLC
ncbi:MAG TPA: 4-(cytidine 5'-diphospho)-2-C-methyl-D-erythritol kinase, partial [Geobacteraceae bacterium]